MEIKQSWEQFWMEFQEILNLLLSGRGTQQCPPFSKHDFSPILRAMDEALVEFVLFFL
jgi:hypothetical protein